LTKTRNAISPQANKTKLYIMKKFSSLFLIGTLLFSLSSCLKDKNIEDKKYGMSGADEAKLAELQSEDGSHLKSFSFDFENNPLTVSIVEVRLTSNELPKNDVTVTLSLANSQTLIDDWNAEHGTNFVAMPINFYTFVGATPLSVVIPAGKRSAFVQLVTNPINYDPSSTYALGFEITGVSDPAFKPSGNFKTLIVTFGAKNAYDGVYEITGTCVDANGLYTGDYGDPVYPRQYSLTTVGGQTGLFYDVSWDYPNYIVINISSGGAANTGIRPKITFDGATKAVTSIVNHNNGAVITVVPGSKFNPSDHSIDLEWILGRWHVTEHWRYIGPR
jgi:hypothetical protein